MLARGVAAPDGGGVSLVAHTAHGAPAETDAAATIATSLERCTLITMHERAPNTVPQADPLAKTRAQPVRPLAPSHPGVLRQQQGPEDAYTTRARLSQYTSRRWPTLSASTVRVLSINCARIR